MSYLPGMRYKKATSPGGKFDREDRREISERRNAWVSGRSRFGMGQAGQGGIFSEGRFEDRRGARRVDLVRGAGEGVQSRRGEAIRKGRGHFTPSHTRARSFLEVLQVKYSVRVEEYHPSWNSGFPQIRLF